MAEFSFADPTCAGRRAFLTGAALAPLAYNALASQEREPTGRENYRLGPVVIRRQTYPDNLEFPFASLNGFFTPNEQFYVRNHFAVPDVNVKSWRLRVEGAVTKPFEISYDELQKMEARTAPALLECSGNSRVFLKPPQIGIRWEQGAVGTAEWTGVSLAVLLERAGLRKEAVDVVLEGADRGEFKEPEPKTPGPISYARALPISKARQPEVLLAYRMNRQELPRNHGFPVRAVVPGWYGMASVKWLTRILVTDRPFRGFFHTFMYSIWQRRGGIPDLVPVTEMQVKAQIARPSSHEVVPANSRYRVFGAAWAGEADVSRVDVSNDGGKTWAQARLLEKSVPFCWRFWEYDWTTPKQPGTVTLMARATDSRKRTQPLERDEDRRDAMISHVQPIRVEVRAT